MPTLRPALRLAPVLAISFVGLLGCQGYHGGGPGMSIDQFTYESYPEFPQTVTLVDHVTGEALWSVEVPVGQKLVLRIKPDENKGDPARPDVMHWDLMALSVRHEPLDNAMPVPPHWQRRIDVTFRDRPGATPPPRP